MCRCKTCRLRRRGREHAGAFSQPAQLGLICEAGVGAARPQHAKMLRSHTAVRPECHKLICGLCAMCHGLSYYLGDVARRTARPVRCQYVFLQTQERSRRLASEIKVRGHVRDV